MGAQSALQQRSPSHPKSGVALAPNSAAAAAPPPLPTTGIQVTIIEARGLKHLNFVGDKLWCQCMVKQKTRRHGNAKCQTRVEKSLEPHWNETFDLDWEFGEQIEFTIYDQGLIGSKSEGSVLLQTEHFFPNGLEDDLPIAGLDHAV